MTGVAEIYLLIPYAHPVGLISENSITSLHSDVGIEKWAAHLFWAAHFGLFSVSRMVGGIVQN